MLFRIGGRRCTHYLVAHPHETSWWPHTRVNTFWRAASALPMYVNRLWSRRQGRTRKVRYCCCIALIYYPTVTAVASKGSIKHKSNDELNLDLLCSFLPYNASDARVDNGLTFDQASMGRKRYEYNRWCRTAGNRIKVGFPKMMITGFQYRPHVYCNRPGSARQNTKR